MAKPEVGQAVNGCSMLGHNFKGMITSLEPPIKTIPTVRVQTTKNENLRCFWFAQDPRNDEAPAALWISCWPATEER